jgi:lysophospholipase L1-like esterase
VGAIKIAAIGSSTTAGEGGIVPYPHRLESALRSRCPGRNFDVLNRGVGGEEAPDELRRMQTDAIAERPSVVIWQVGTNGKCRTSSRWQRPFARVWRFLPVRSSTSF